ncbi:hypothetical protein JCM3774_002430 [Rhodotorula dairenensis]
MNSTPDYPADTRTSPSIAPHAPHSATATASGRGRSPQEIDMDNDSDQDDPVFDPPLRVAAAAAARAPPRPLSGGSAPPGVPAAAGPGTAFRDSPVKRKRFGGLVWELENKGAVARDHLALERTFLAWLRTSLALASIGIAVTQLFRLPTATSTAPQNVASAAAEESLPAFVINSIASSSYPSLAAIAPILEAQQAQLATLSQNAAQFSYLAKPIGGTFLALALLFLVLGTYRFFHVQAAFVSEPSMFPPSRKTYGFTTFCIGALIVATFAAILATT